MHCIHASVPGTHVHRAVIPMLSGEGNHKEGEMEQPIDSVFAQPPRLRLHGLHKYKLRVQPEIGRDLTHVHCARFN